MKFIITEEQNEKFNQKVKSMVNKFGIEHTLTMFDDNTDIIRRTYQDNPLEFLNQFNDLTPVEKDDKIYYVDKNRLPLFYYYRNKNYTKIYFDNSRIWLFFSRIIGLSYDNIKVIMKKWLEETYNIKGLTPTYDYILIRIGL